MEANNKRNSLLHSSISKKIIGVLVIAMFLCSVVVGFFIIPMAVDIINQS